MVSCDQMPQRYEEYEHPDRLPRLMRVEHMVIVTSSHKWTEDKLRAFEWLGRELPPHVFRQTVTWNNREYSSTEIVAQISQAQRDRALAESARANRSKPKKKNWLRNGGDKTPSCPHCEGRAVKIGSRSKKSHRYRCKGCKRDFSVKLTDL